MEMYFREIPKQNYSIGAIGVLVRMLDGLGFRFYWATEGLSNKNWTFRPSDQAMSFEETVQHIAFLHRWIFYTADGKSIDTNAFKDLKRLSHPDLCTIALSELWEARKLLLQKDDADLQLMELRLERQNNPRHAPFWNLINGPLADAIYHTGQLVSFRRTSGNPIAKGVDVFLGKKWEH
ncbi:MAG: hypothetical protein OIF50_06835 [Flavobacteriaceae bacterium]|nr:hypothetical protein [Flavobacteriaceae bacterium]